MQEKIGDKFILLEDYIEGKLPNGEPNIILKKDDVVYGKISERGYLQGNGYLIQVGIWCTPTIEGCEIRSGDDSYVESKERKVFILIQYFKKIKP